MSTCLEFVQFVILNGIQKMEKNAQPVQIKKMLLVLSLVPENRVQELLGLGLMNQEQKLGIRY